MTAGTRNLLIVVALGSAAFFLPGGGSTAAFVGAILTIAVSAAFALIGARMYRENRVAIYSLGDQHRALLYGAIGLAVLAMAALPRLKQTGLGVFVWLVLIAGASLALMQVIRHNRALD